jgi:beta-xylosidase/S-formylglutathione hydrolase FrmB
MTHLRSVATIALVLLTGPASASHAQTWRPDNGNGTFTNPLFQDEFSDPDIIRVGNDFYLTGTTMHAMPGLPVLHSTDLVNWELMSYALDRLDLAPEFRLEGGKEVYGRGIWAPSFRYHNGTFHIFSNVNGQTTQHFTATDPRGPWKRTAMKRAFHDLSVLFDDDGKVYVVWGYRDLHIAQLDSALTDAVPGTERALFDKNSLMGEGAHFYKINGKYYITSAWYAERMRMPAARADRIEGPWEVNPAISADEDFGLREGARLRGNGNGPQIVVNAANPASRGHMSMHQGGIVQTPAGEWWGWSMYEGNSVGRLTALSPVTWKDGWPYFGLPGNLGRTPRTWVKPSATSPTTPIAPYVRSDDFAGPALANVWQWNHVPDDTKWSLRERPGFLRLHALPAADFWTARNSLTQRAIGPQSQPTAVLETAGMRPGDVAGLALLNRPYAWIGVRRGDDGAWLEQFDQLTGDTVRVAFPQSRVWLRVDGDFLTERATFSYSTDGTRFVPLGKPFGMIFQLKTFQGVRYALFSYNARGAAGGYADFDAMHVVEPRPRGLSQPIPIGKTITLRSAGRDTPLAVGGQQQFSVIDRSLGRVALRAGTRYLSVAPASDSTSSVALREGTPGDGETFQWIETPYGDLTLMALSTHRYLRIETDGRVTSDSRGPSPDVTEGTALRWRDVTPPALVIPPRIANAPALITERIKVHGKSLEGNLEGDSPDRDVIVYLPPSYAKNRTRRYPVVYALHGYSISNEKWSTEIKTPQTIEGAFATGTREMIVVLANAQTLHNGSMYSNSVTTGNWEDFISRDLVSYIDAHYRTIANRLSRGIAGHSMGGYGTVRIAMRHPDVYSAFYAMSPCCMSARGAPPAEMAKRIEAAVAAGESASLDFFTRATLASAAAWSPNPKAPPFYLDLPTKDGVAQPSVLARWAANAPLAMVDQYVANLKQYKAIALDVGDRDGLRVDTAELHRLLDLYGIPNAFDLYAGDHVSAVADRMQNHVMPFFGRALAFPR